MPFTAEKIWHALNLSGNCAESEWSSIGEIFIEAGHKISEPGILFAKIDDNNIKYENDKLLGLSESGQQPTAGLGTASVIAKSCGSESVSNSNQISDKNQIYNKTEVLKSQATLAAQQQPQITEVVDIVDIQYFGKIQLRIAEVVAAENIPKSDKLLKLQLRIADETRQIVAGIAQYYKPSEMIGKKIVVVYNLKPAKIFKIDSQGMLLAAKIDSKLTLITPESDIPSGAIVG